jgi:hypothetical protein
VGRLLRGQLALAKAALDRNNAFIAVLTLSSVELQLKVLAARHLLSSNDAGPLAALIAALIRAAGAVTP